MESIFQTLNMKYFILSLLLVLEKKSYINKNYKITIHNEKNPLIL